MSQKEHLWPKHLFHNIYIAEVSVVVRIEDLGTRTRLGCVLSYERDCRHQPKYFLKDLDQNHPSLPAVRLRGGYPWQDDGSTSGAKTVTPTTSTTCHLIAKGAGGSADASVRVTVSASRRRPHR